MHIAIVGHSQDGGGAEYVTRVWAEGLTERGHQVTLFGVDGPRTAAVAAAFGSITVDDWAPTGVRTVRLAIGSGHLDKVRVLRRELRNGRYDVCLAMQTYPSLLTISAAFGLRHAPRVLISERSVPSVLLKRQGLGRRAQLTLARRMYRFADAAIAISHPVAGDLVSSFHLDPGRVHVVPNPAAAKAAGAHIGPRLESEYEISLVLPARLVQEKQPLLAAGVAEELARRGRKVELLSFGVGPLRDELERRSAVAGVPTRFNGWVDGWMSDLPASAVVLLPSACEGFGNVLVEAAAAGIPSVALSGALGVADAIVPGLTGELAISDDPRAIADAVEKAVTLRVDARPWLERFSPGSSTAHLLAVFEHVLSGR